MVRFGEVRSFREWVVREHDMTAGDDIALERLDCEAAACRAIMVRRPDRAAAIRSHLKAIKAQAADIVRRYA